MRINNRAAVIATAAALSMALAVPAQASEVVVSGGTLGFSVAPSAGDFAAVTLDGTAKQTTGSLSAYEVSDGRGTGAGWNVTVGATQLKEWDSVNGAYVVGGKSLPTGSLALAQPTVTADGTTSTAPSVTTGPYTIDSGSASKIASAAVDTGMGRYDFSASTLTLSVPASAYAKTYRSTVTVTLATGP
jgi:hypothetical protein